MNKRFKFTLIDGDSITISGDDIVYNDNNTITIYRSNDAVFVIERSYLAYVSIM